MGFVGKKDKYCTEWWNLGLTFRKMLKKAKNAFLILCAVLTVVGLLGGIYGLTRIIINDYRLKHNRSFTTGTIVETGDKHCNNDRRETWIVYQYSVDGKAYEESDCRLGNNPVGKTFLVIYWKPDPTVHRIVLEEWMED